MLSNLTMWRKTWERGDSYGAAGAAAGGYLRLSLRKPMQMCATTATMQTNSNDTKKQMRPISIFDKPAFGTVGVAWRVSIGVKALDVELTVAEGALEAKVMKLVKLEVSVMVEYGTETLDPTSSQQLKPDAKMRMELTRR